jgi:hypothetical protein
VIASISGRRLAAAACVGLLACAPPGVPPSGPAPAPAPAAGAPPVASAPAPEARSWTFRYAPGIRRYEVLSEATIEMKSDTAPQSAPIRTLTLVTLRLDPAPDGGITVNASVDSSSLTLGGAIPAPDSTLATRATFQATISSTGQIVSPPASTAESGACNPADPLVATARALIVGTPPVLDSGARWSDSASTTVCNGSVPVTTGAVRDYEVEGRETLNGTPAIRVRRRETFTLAGAGTVHGQPLSVTGRGTAEGTLYFDPAAGVYLGGTETSESTLTVSDGRRPTPFVQRVTRRVTMRR